MQAIEEMVSKLVDNPEVLGLLEYGSARKEDAQIMGDYDLVAILEEKDPDVESLHFCVESVPVDLNLRTLDEIHNLERAEGFNGILLHGRIIHDTGEQVAEAIQALARRHAAKSQSRAPRSAFGFERHGTKHVFDKIRDRKKDMPVFCAYLLHQNVYWLVRHYFACRDLDFKGDKAALEYFQRRESSLFRSMEAFYATCDLAEQEKLCREIAEAVLKPVGGVWRTDEVLTFGNPEKGKEAFNRLFGR